MDLLGQIVNSFFKDVIPDGKRKLLAKNQTINDIAQGVVMAEYNSRKQTMAMANYLKANIKNPVEQMEYVHNWVRRNLKYDAEPRDKQTVKEFNKILTDFRHGNDCKHFSIGIGGLLRALNIPYFFRMVSYDKYDKSPTHIYPVARYNGKDYVLDACMRRFNEEQPFTNKFQFKPLKSIL